MSPNHVAATPDHWTQVGTLLTAGAAVLGLFVTIWLAARDRRQQRRELVRLDHRKLLLDIAEQYARHEGVKNQDGQAAVEPETLLKVYLHLVPGGVATLLKFKFDSLQPGHGRSDDGPTLRHRLTRNGLTGGDQDQIKDQVTNDMIYAELRDNADEIAAYGKYRTPKPGWRLHKPITLASDRGLQWPFKKDSDRWWLQRPIKFLEFHRPLAREQRRETPPGA